jgi:hypothetical protein
MIKTRPESYARRQMIRETWSNASVLKHVNTARRFVVGSSSQEKGSNSLLIEQQLHGDLLQGPFEDNYRNTSRKTIFSFRWVARYCNNSKFVIFLDDDVLVNPYNLQNFLLSPKTQSIEKLLSGLVKPPSKPIRKPCNWACKWAISYSDYPWEMYPPYVAAGAMIVNQEFIADFVAAVPFVKQLPFDDVYIGIVAHKLRIQPQNMPSIYNTWNFKLNFSKHGDFVVSFGEYNTREIETLWRSFVHFVSLKRRIPSLT